MIAVAISLRLSPIHDCRERPLISADVPVITAFARNRARLSDIEPDFVCTACGKRGDVGTARSRHRGQGYGDGSSFAAQCPDKGRGRWSTQSVKGMLTATPIRL
jgi:hypothetical protein